MKRGAGVVAAVAGACALLAAGPARATGFTDIGEDIVPRTRTAVELDGYLRARAYDYYNFDLDRGLTPSGQPLFPVPLGDPGGQAITGADMRLRTDISVFAPGGMMAVRARIDVLDNVALGSNFQGVPSSSSTQLSPSNAFKVQRAYGEAVTPIGVIAAGRIGSTWGMGILANGGDCADCNYGDAADRIALITPLAGHIFALAYDIDQIGPFQTQQPGETFLNLAPTANVNTVTFAFLRFKDELSRERRRAAGKTTVEYGAYVSDRWQNSDVPGTYLPTAQPLSITSSQVMSRGYEAAAIDGWLRITHPWFRIEAEWAALFAQIQQASLIPGVLYRVPVTGQQMGGAIESEFGPVESRFSAGLDAGYASGDPSPGFGANVQANSALAQPGDLNGAKADPPFHTTVEQLPVSPRLLRRPHPVSRDHRHRHRRHVRPAPCPRGPRARGSRGAAGERRGHRLVRPLRPEHARGPGTPRRRDRSHPGVRLAATVSPSPSSTRCSSPWPDSTTPSRTCTPSRRSWPARVSCTGSEPMRSIRPTAPASVLSIAFAACACAWSAACEDNLTHPPDTTPYEAGTTAPLSCVPNLDGTIQSSELQPTLGISANYLVNPSGTTRMVDVEGQVNSSGQLVWDWGTSYANDQVAKSKPRRSPASGTRRRSRTAQYVTPFDAADTLEAVYSQDDGGASHPRPGVHAGEPALGQDALGLRHARDALRVPAHVGTSWTSIGHRARNGDSATACPTPGTDTYQGTDDAAGQLILPDFMFTQAHRVRFVVTTTSRPAACSRSRRQVSFLFECFGEVGRATSQTNETNDNFTTAAEARRLGM